MNYQFDAIGNSDLYCDQTTSDFLPCAIGRTAVAYGHSLPTHGWLIGNLIADRKLEGNLISWIVPHFNRETA